MHRSKDDFARFSRRDRIQSPARSTVRRFELGQRRGYRSDNPVKPDLANTDLFVVVFHLAET